MLLLLSLLIWRYLETNAAASNWLETFDITNAVVLTNPKIPIPEVIANNTIC
jgi:hypothetical protein